jgi:hypothetical protein
MKSIFRRVLLAISTPLFILSLALLAVGGDLDQALMDDDLLTVRD